MIATLPIRHLRWVLQHTTYPFNDKSELMIAFTVEVLMICVLLKSIRNCIERGMVFFYFREYTCTFGDRSENEGGREEEGFERFFLFFG